MDFWGEINNEQLRRLFGEVTVFNYMKAERLIWFGHIQRMGQTRLPKQVTRSNPRRIKKRGHPRTRWQHNTQRIERWECEKMKRNCERQEKLEEND